MYGGRINDSRAQTLERDLVGWDPLLGAHTLIDEQVYARIEGDELVVAHQSRDGVSEVARHRTAPPEQPQLDLLYYPPARSPRILEVTPWRRAPGESAFLALGSGAVAWLTKSRPTMRRRNRAG